MVRSIIETPRDRDGTFQPETVKKRETILANGMAADQIIERCTPGHQRTRDISSYFEREFNTTLSADTISSITTDRVLPEITAWCLACSILYMPFAGLMLSIIR